MASKLVTARQKSAEAVIAITEAQAAATGAALSAQLGAYVQAGEQVPDLPLLLQLMARMLRQRTLDLVAADQANLAELADDPPTRDSRDQAAEALSARLVALRDTVRGIYGPDQASRIFAGSTPGDPTALVGFAVEAADRLDSAELPAARVPGVSLDLGALSAELRTLASAVDSALSAVARENREAQATLVAKQRAMAAYDASFTGVAAFMGSVLTLTEQFELAARVRPSRKRPGRTAEPDPSDDTAPVPDASADADASPCTPDSTTA